MCGEKFDRSWSDEWNAKTNEWDFDEEIEWNDVAAMAEEFSGNQRESEQTQERAWKLPEKPAREGEVQRENTEVLKLEEVMTDLGDGNYELLGHGTVSAELAERIMIEGVEVGGPERDTDTDSNFGYLSHKFETLRDELDTWRHNAAQQIVLLRVPVKYKLPFGSHNQNTYGVFYHDQEDEQSAESDGQRGVYESDYVYGWYDAGTGEVHKNANYHGDLNNPEDVAYMEKVYEGIKQSYLEQLSDDEREDFEAVAKMYYDYQPE